jgi:hypothetical protein
LRDVDGEGDLLLSPPSCMASPLPFSPSSPSRSEVSFTASPTLLPPAPLENLPTSPLACPPAPPELPESPPPERRLPTRHRRLPNLHRLSLSRRLQRLGRLQIRHHLRDFNINTTGISATSAESTIIKSHISTAGFATTNKIYISVNCPQQGGGQCASLVPVYMCVYMKGNKNIKEKNG